MRLASGGRSLTSSQTRLSSYLSSSLVSSSFLCPDLFFPVVSSHAQLLQRSRRETVSRRPSLPLFWLSSLMPSFLPSRFQNQRAARLLGHLQHAIRLKTSHDPYGCCFSLAGRSLPR